MIFQIIGVYQKAKQGITDPQALALDEINGAFWGFFLVPGVILLAIIIVLGLLSFTSVIAQPSGVAQFFFWLFTSAGMVYAIIVIALKRLLNKVVHYVHRALDQTRELS